MTIEAAPRAAAPAKAAPAKAADRPMPLRGATVIIALAIIGSIYGQRFIVPGVRISVGFVIMIVLAGAALLMNIGRIQLGRALIAVALAGFASAMALASGVWTPFDPSLESLLLLIVAWLPFVVIARGRAPWTPVRWDVVFFWCALPAAFAVILQFAMQFTGIGFLDPIMDLPAEIRYTQEEYSVSYEFIYGSGLQKPNGFFFAEPSLAAQFMGLGAFAALAYKPWWAIVFASAVALTASGTGTIALAIGIPFAIIAARPILRVMLVSFIVVAIPVVLSTPLIGDAFLGRSEAVANQDDGSSNARFVDPFAIVAWWVQRFPQTVLTGMGPGTSEQAAEATTYNEANASFIAKATLEYGVPFALAFTFILAFAILSARGVSFANRIVLGAMIFFLSGALIQGSTGLLLWSALFAAPSRRDQFDVADPPLWLGKTGPASRWLPFAQPGRDVSVTSRYR